MVLLSALAKKLNLSVSGEGDPEISGLTCDSRAVDCGDLFAAVPGALRNGRDFIPQALEKGAAALMLADGDSPFRLPRLVVPAAKMRRLMASAAAEIYGRPAEKLAMIGLTGTNGKTTSAYLLESVLNRAGWKPGVMGTINFRWPGQVKAALNTTPEGPELQANLSHMVESGAKAAILEISSHALKLGRVAGLEFDWALFTNLGHDHLDFHKDLEAYFAAKKLLFSEHLKEGPGRAAVNLDDHYGRRLAAELGERAIGFGFSEKARVRGSDLKMDRRGLSLMVETPAGSWRQASPLLGEVNAHNILGVIALGLAMDIDKDLIREALAEAKGAPGRLEPVGGNADYLVLVDYAHTPEALEEVLSAARELGDKRLLVVFGCGGDRDRGKRPLMGRIAHRLADIKIITSDNPRTEEPWSIVEDVIAGLPSSLTRYEVGELNNDEVAPLSYIVAVDRRAAIHEAVRLMAPGDVLLIAGKGHEDYQIIGHEKRPFDDRGEALAALKDLGRLG